MHLRSYNIFESSIYNKSFRNRMIQELFLRRAIYGPWASFLYCQHRDVDDTNTLSSKHRAHLKYNHFSYVDIVNIATSTMLTEY